MNEVVNLECELQWLNQAILDLATRKIYLAIVPNPDKQWRWGVKYRHTQNRFAVLAPLLDGVTRGKYERLLRELNAGVALHLAKHQKFPSHWSATA